MVNQAGDIKSNIIRMLKESLDIVSGVRISRELSLSRVAVWKNIQKLRELGFGIKSTAKGYTLESEPDTMYPWQVGGQGFTVHYLRETDSTMTVARDLAEHGCAEHTLVVADTQQAGRGRRTNVFVSDYGGLYMTLILRIPLPLSLAYCFNFLASLTIAQVLREICAVDTKVKWPNDVFAAAVGPYRKVCGILTDLKSEADYLVYLSLGMGININNNPPPEVTTAASLRQLTGREFSRRAVLTAFMCQWQANLGRYGCVKQVGGNWTWQRQSLVGLVEDWKALCLNMHEHVTIVRDGEVLHGFAQDIDVEGALVLRLANGETARVLY